MTDTTSSYIEGIWWKPGGFAIEVLIKKIRFNDSGNVLFFGNHRTVLDPETPVDLQLSFVNNSLTSLGFDGVTTEDWQKVRDVVNQVFTTDVIDTFKRIMESE